MLNPALDIDALAAEFKKDDRVRINDILEPGIAEQIREICLTDVPFQYIYFFDGANRVGTEEQLRNLTPEQRHELQQKILTAAADGVGFYYCGYVMGYEDRNVGNEKLQFLHTMFDFMNSSDMREFIMKVTGRDDLLSADAQFTRFTNGQFLTRHRDVVTDQERRLAYVISFSPDWHPDWGGLLQYFEEDGTPRDAWTPRFNSMSLFDVRHIHSVTYLTPFGKAPRLSLTGWFRAVPQQR